MVIIVFITSLSLQAIAKKAAIVIDFDTKEVLFETNADTRNYPASLTKMMTLYVVFDFVRQGKLSLDDHMLVSRTAASRSPSKLYLEEGSSIKVIDAVNALIIKSANDVATVVSEKISGSEREFAKLMTKYARNLGMNSTTFKNASGLPNRAQLTTARDMSKLSHALITNFPEEYKLFSNKSFVWNDKIYKTHNKLMLNYDGADGIKTGYIRASGFQLAFSAVRNNKRLIGIYFGGDTGKQRNDRLKLYMNNAYNKLKVTNTTVGKNELQNKNDKIKIPNIKEYSIVVGTFKYRKNALKQIDIIKSKYPKTTTDKTSDVVFIEVSGKKLYESRFNNFSKKDAYQACKRLAKYGRDCFVRL